MMTNAVFAVWGRRPVPTYCLDEISKCIIRSGKVVLWLRMKIGLFLLQVRRFSTKMFKSMSKSSAQTGLLGLIGEIVVDIVQKKACIIDILEIPVLVTQLLERRKL